MSDTPVYENLERLIKAKGSLDLGTTDGGGMGYKWCATLGGEWPYCYGFTIEGALKSLVSEHIRIEREQLQKRINEIDASAAL